MGKGGRGDDEVLCAHIVYVCADGDEGGRVAESDCRGKHWRLWRQDNDEECGDLMEELDFHIACYVKKYCEEQKEKVDSGNVVVEMIE